MFRINAEYIHKHMIPVNIFLEHYTSKCLKKQANMNIICIFVYYDNFYVNKVMLTNETLLNKICILGAFQQDVGFLLLD